MGPSSLFSFLFCHSGHGSPVAWTCSLSCLDRAQASCHLDGDAGGGGWRLTRPVYLLLAIAEANRPPAQGVQRHPRQHGRPARRSCSAVLRSNQCDWLRHGPPAGRTHRFIALLSPACQDPSVSNDGMGIGSQAYRSNVSPESAWWCVVRLRAPCCSVLQRSSAAVQQPHPRPAAIRLSAALCGAECMPSVRARSGERFIAQAKIPQICLAER